MAPFTASFDDLYSAMSSAEYLEDDRLASLEAVVDADGTVYNGYEAVLAWLAAYRKAHPQPEPESNVKVEPPPYREIRGERWRIE